MEFKVGDIVYVPKETNDQWMGEGTVVEIYSGGPTLVMDTGKMAGERGGFDKDEVVLIKSKPTPPTPSGTIWVNENYNDDPKRYLIFIQTEKGIYWFNPLTGDSSKREYSLSTAEALDDSSWVRVVPGSRR